MDGFGGGDDEEEDGGGGAGGGRKGGKRLKGGSSFADASEFAAMLDEAVDPNEGANPRLADWESGKRGARRPLIAQLEPHDSNFSLLSLTHMSLYYSIYGHSARQPSLGAATLTSTRSPSLIPRVPGVW